MEKEPPDLSYYKCIKTSLKSIAKNDFVISKLNDSTIMANKIVIHSLQFLKLYLNLYDNNEKLPVINKQFINSILKTVCSSSSKGRPPSETTKGIKDTLKIFYDLHYIKFKPLIKNVYFDRISKLPSKYISIHIRNTDKKCCNINAFINNYENLLLNNKFFLGTDDYKTLQLYKEKFNL